MDAEDELRNTVRHALAAADMSQALAAHKLGLSTKHLNAMLTDRAPLTIAWAEALVRLCGWDLQIGLAAPQLRYPTSPNR